MSTCEKDIRGIDQAAYLAKGGGVCPNEACGGTNVEGHDITIEGRSMYQKCSCHDCECEWNDSFQLTGFSDLKHE